MNYSVKPTAFSTDKRSSVTRPILGTPLWVLVLCVLTGIAIPRAGAQRIYHYERDNAHLIFFDQRLNQYIPHLMRMYESGLTLHRQLWDTDTNHPYRPEAPMMMLTDWEDDGNAGVSAIPYNIIQIGMAPLNFSYHVAPSTERYHHLFRHEYTHVVMTDKSTRSEERWRRFFGGKFNVNNQQPLSALWSYLGAPRWYAPRWYHEGIACFLETWMGGGFGRALGGYDEMNFRAMVQQDKAFSSVVGLETDGTTRDFQLGNNSYLYGTRFVNYLAYRYGLDSLIAFYNHTDDSKTLFNRQFEKVYGKSLRTVWDEWIGFEHEHQRANLAAVSAYPLTPLRDLCGASMGSVSPPVVDSANGCFYVAANYPGDFAHIERVSLADGERERLVQIDGPMFYQTSYVALDQRRQRLIFTTQNSKYRSLTVYDLNRNKIIDKKKYQRVSNIVYDNQGDHLYGLLTNAGVIHLVRYDSTLTDIQVLYTFPFGQSVLDLDVSHSGQWLTATTTGMNGEQTLIRFATDSLDQAVFTFDTLYTSTETNLGQFRFTSDDRAMVGSSYYTGVSNLWKLDLATGHLALLSNTDLGLFAPVEVGDSLLALAYDADGMRPVMVPQQELYDANAITYLGQRAHDAHPDALESIGTYRDSVRKVNFGDVYHDIKTYHPFTALKFTGAYPEVSAFRDRAARAGITPVAGYRFQFSDPLGIHSLKVGVGLSPWSHNDPQNQYHADLAWHFWGWDLDAAWNRSNFYDFFGPLLSSRKGWSAALTHSRTYNLQTPFSWNWGATVALYGGMDAMPLYQNVDIDINSFQYCTAHIGAEKNYTTLGGILAEKGWSVELDATAYLADRHLYPSLSLNAKKGWLLPLLRHTCFWIYGDAGANLGDENTAFGNEYFGGFRNNYVDYRSYLQYRRVNAMPGTDIDAIKAHNYGKLTAELNLPPIHFNDFGFLNLYPTHIHGSLFSTLLSTNPFQDSRNTYWNIGVQANIEVILFKYLKTTFSVGYAQLWQYQTDGSQGEWMFSVKLL